MKKVLFTLTAVAGMVISASAQKYLTKLGNVSFVNKGILETVEARSTKVTATINSQTGAVEFSMPVKTFTFEKTYMEKEFNETYMESAQYPTCSFQGKIADMSKVNFTTEGTYTVSLTGNLTIHGVSKSVSTPATVIVKGGKVSASCNFKVTLADYNILIPDSRKDVISKNVDIKVNTGNCEKMN